MATGTTKAKQDARDFGVAGISLDNCLEPDIAGSDCLADAVNMNGVPEVEHQDLQFDKPLTDSDGIVFQSIQYFHSGWNSHKTLRISCTPICGSG